MDCVLWCCEGCVAASSLDRSMIQRWAGLDFIFLGFSAVPDCDWPTAEKRLCSLYLSVGAELTESRESHTTENNATVF